MSTSVNGTDPERIRAELLSISEESLDDMKIGWETTQVLWGVDPIEEGPALRVAYPGDKERSNSMGLILLILVVLFLVGALPTWPHSKNWGYYPSGGLGLVVVILLVLVLAGRI